MRSWDETSVCQPALFLAGGSFAFAQFIAFMGLGSFWAGMAALEVLRETRPEAADRPQAVAGLSYLGSLSSS